ncbi:unnamed protein product [Ceutorhynchus assimilis]|uniref:Uncharacterized protein n=1 Tax=Ceutorhynchus assimilis TaxID=467358 RepID=A0A9N9MV49_9CUCU|nr:unnamed protein product [Ceutorhynchus assimilis]
MFFPFAADVTYTSTADRLMEFFLVLTDIKFDSVDCHKRENDQPPNILSQDRALISSLSLKAAQIQILEGEATIATYQKRVASEKEIIVLLNAELDQTRADRLTLLHNNQVQFVLSKGLVEIPLTGDLYTDFVDAILLPKSEIYYVNSLIVKAGKLKLKTIQQNMKFRRTVMVTEWKHMKLRMLINDYIEEIKDIEAVKFTKQMQDYLKHKTEGRQANVESYELEMELLSIVYGNEIKDKKEKAHKLDQQLEMYKESNKELDTKIKDVNIQISSYRLEKDYEVEAKEREILQASSPLHDTWSFEPDTRRKYDEEIRKIIENTTKKYEKSLKVIGWTCGEVQQLKNRVQLQDI